MPNNDLVRVLVLGATGSVGRLIADLAASRGHEVTGLARRPQQAAAAAGIRLVAGNVLSDDDVQRAVSGQDAVIYAVGAGFVRRTTLFSDSARTLVKAMRLHDVRRLIAITGVGAGETRGHGGFLYDRILYPLFTRGVYADKNRQEAIIRASDLEWTIVRPASFKDARPRGELQIALDVAGITLRSIARGEVAEFVVAALEDGSYVRQAPFIGHS